MGNLKNIDILERILHCCDKINKVAQHCGNSLDELKADELYTDAASMCVYMIGQLANHLTGDFKAAYDGTPWRFVGDWSNLTAYRHDVLDRDKLWRTMTSDIPELRQYCEQIITQYNVLECDALPALEPDMTM
jgi:uncharacterized protein with HEPN domain